MIGSYHGTVDLEWHDTPGLWIAYNGCGCYECPKGYGKTKEEAIADLEDCANSPRYRSSATRSS